MLGQQDSNSHSFTQQACMLSWLYLEYINIKGMKEKKVKLIANNKDSIIHVTQWSKPPYMFLAEQE